MFELDYRCFKNEIDVASMLFGCKNSPSGRIGYLKINSKRENV